MKNYFNRSLMNMRITGLIFMLVILLIILMIVNISLGSVYIPFSKIISYLAGSSLEEKGWENIIFQFRMPKAITAVLVGSGLGVSGLLMQTLFRNPLAGPFVLGISSGASLGVAIAILAGMSFGTVITQLGIGGSWILTFSASLGAFAVLSMVIIVSLRIRDSMSLLIIGLMFGSATGAIVSVLQFFSKAESIQAYLIWTFGSLGGLTWEELTLFIPVILLSLFWASSLSKPLNALLLGDQYAQSVGLNIRKTRLAIIIVTSLLAGTITAFCGPIAFIGIAIPHITRLLFNTANHKLLFPLVIICGAILMLICDIIAQMPGREYTLPINAVTSVLGAPIVIWLVIRRRDFSKSFGA
jgi:iron complex transport system permease protein